VKAVRDWMSRAFDDRNSLQILIIYGGSGSCKSVLIDKVCDDVGAYIFEIDESVLEMDSSRSYNPFKSFHYVSELENPNMKDYQSSAQVIIKRTTFIYI